MRYIFYALLLTAAMSCKKYEPINYNGNNCIDNNEDFSPINTSNDNFKTYYLTFYSNSRLEITETSEISVTRIPGDKVVFQYMHHYQDTMPDGFRDEKISFEIDSNIESFILSDSDLKRAGAVFSEGCFCPENKYYWVGDGCIKGKKISDMEWQIDINIVVRTEYNSLSATMISDIFK